MTALNLTADLRIAPASAASWWPRVALAVIVLASMTRPGDAPWLNDEPLLIKLAWDCNITHTKAYGIPLPFEPAPVGLLGTRGAMYGPFPAWLYQIMLIFTRNPVVLISIRAGLVNAVTAIALYWLVRIMRVSPWLAVVTLLSPWQWIYARQLWDNSFSIPLSALLLASYGDFLRSRRGWTIVLSAFCASALVLTHFMCVALLAPIAVHAVIFQYHRIYRHWWKAAIVVGLMQFIAWPYWWNFIHYYKPDRPEASHLLGWLYPMMGAHHLAADGLGNILGDRWFASSGGFFSFIIVLAETISLAAYPAVWLGMVISLRMALRSAGSSAHQLLDQSVEPAKSAALDSSLQPVGKISYRSPGARAADPPADVMLDLSMIGLGVWAVQSVLDGIERVYGYPHYYNATWVIYAIFAWIACDAVYRRWGRVSIVVKSLLPVFAVSLLVMLIGMNWWIAQNGGARDAGYGTVLSNQLAVVNQLQKYPPGSKRNSLYKLWNDYPHAARTLWDLTAQPAVQGVPRRILIYYSGDFPDAHLKIADGPMPPAATQSSTQPTTESSAPSTMQNSTAPARP